MAVVEDRSRQRKWQGISEVGELRRSFELTRELADFPTDQIERLESAETVASEGRIVGNSWPNRSYPCKMVPPPFADMSRIKYFFLFSRARSRMYVLIA